MTQVKEIEMKMNENIRTIPQDDVIELGVASTETKGGPFTGEDIGGPNALGISEE
jgi:hypothetical protein